MGVLVALCALIVAFALSSFTAPLIINEGFAVPRTAYLHTYSAQVAQWNPAHPLDWIVFSVDLTGTIDRKGENFAQIPQIATFGVGINGVVHENVGFLLQDRNARNLSPDPSGSPYTVDFTDASIALSAFDGTFDFGGTSGFTLRPQEQNAPNSGSLFVVTDPAVLAQFIGTGTCTVQVYVTGEQNNNDDGLNDLDLVSRMRAGGGVNLMMVGHL
jgi:hypothetical protein